MCFSCRGLLKKKDSLPKREKFKNYSITSPWIRKSLQLSGDLLDTSKWYKKASPRNSLYIPCKFVIQSTRKLLTISLTLREFTGPPIQNFFSFHLEMGSNLLFSISRIEKGLSNWLIISQNIL